MEIMGIGEWNKMYFTFEVRQPKNIGYTLELGERGTADIGNLRGTCKLKPES